jgi:predicted outer membrane repeat protein
MPVRLFSFPVVLAAAVLARVVSVTAAAATFTVTNDASDGPGSFRQAVLAAAAEPAGAPSEVVFEPVFFEVPRTVVLVEALPILKRSMTIEGPPLGENGQPVLTITGDVNGNGFADAGDRPGLYFEVPATGVVTLRRLAFAGCRSTATPGGAVYFRPSGPATLVIEQCRFVGNAGRWGGAVSVSGDGHQATLRDSVFTGNQATEQDGGAVHLGSAPALVERCEFRQNAAPRGGGAIHTFHGAAEMRECLFEANEALAGGNGGAISARVGLRVAASTFVGNRARAGGAIFLNQMLAPAPGAVLENCTFSGNLALASSGGGIYAVGSDALLRHCTFTLNHANSQAAVDAFASGGAIAVPGAANVNRLRLHNCVMAGNQLSGIGPSTGIDLHGPAASFLSLGGNVVGIGEAQAAAFNQTGDRVGTLVEPLAAGLSPLAANGGLAPTHLPLPESPVVDTGVAGPDPVIAVDQRGQSRPGGVAPDAGAVELITPGLPD